MSKRFFNKSYNFNETTKFIQTYYQVKLCENKMESVSRVVDRRVKSNNAHIPVQNKSADTDKTMSNKYREIANEYFRIRQEYFEKANEAHSRGWGAVAQYYAELVRILNFLFCTRGDK